MSDSSSSGITAIVAVVAIVIILGVGYFVVQNFRGQDSGTPSVNVQIPGGNGQ
jgi:hypothetical protein